jgi:Hint domain
MSNFTINGTNNNTQTLNAGQTGAVKSSGALITSTTDPSVTINGGSSGTDTLTNSGTIQSTGDRAINIKSPKNDSQTVDITNNAGAKILGSMAAVGAQNENNDAVHVKGDFTGGSITFTNSGFVVAGDLDSNNNVILASGATTSGQALDFDDVASSLITIDNKASGVIAAADSDAIRPGADVLINNRGLIEAYDLNSDTTQGNDAISFQDHTSGSATINNFAKGQIIGAHHGITGEFGITVNNDGLIQGQLGSGINMDTTSTSGTTIVVNHGTIEGNAGGSTDGDGIDVDYLLNLDNYGSVLATGTSTAGLSEAITIGGGTINNFAGGVIKSNERAITVDDSNGGNAFGPTTIYNEGRIVGGNGEAISITDTFADTVTNKGTINGSVSLGDGDDIFNDYTGSTLKGTLDGGDGNDTLNLLLGADKSTGTVGTVVNFETLDVQGGTWTLSTFNFFDTVNLDGGVLDVAALNGAGTGAVNFLDGAQELILEDAAIQTGDFANVIDGFGTDDQIDFVDLADATSADIGPDGHSVTLSDDTGEELVTLHFDPAQSFDGMYFHLADDGNGGVVLTESDVACYCRGTLILTEQGERPVESLDIGDHVVTVAGRRQPIKWIGHRAYGGRYIVGRKDMLPICIKAGALDEGVPRRDLWISPHHAMFIDGVLIEARDLVNGVSIVQAERVEQVEYFHIELETHDVIMAEGAPSETFIDDDSRSMFHNAHQYAALYPKETRRTALYCAPRLDVGHTVEAIRLKLARRAGIGAGREPDVDPLRGFVDAVSRGAIEGWAQNAGHPEAAVCLDILAGGRLLGRTLANLYRDDLRAAGLGSGRHAFRFELPSDVLLHPAAVVVRRSIDGAVLATWAATQADAA